MTLEQLRMLWALLHLFKQDKFNIDLDNVIQMVEDKIQTKTLKMPK